MAIEVGQQAPDFTLFDSDKNEVTLSGLQGQNVLMLFYPLAFTGTCTKEMCMVRDNISSYNDVNAKVLGISIDNAHVQKKFKEEMIKSYELSSEFENE